MIEMALALLLGVVVFFYLWVQRRHHYWNSKGLPQPPTVFGFGHVLDAFLCRLNTGLIIDRIYRAYPDHDAVGVYDFLTPKLLVRSPELAKRVLVSEFSSFHDNEIYVSKQLDPLFSTDPFVQKGEEWKHGRSKLVAMLTASRLKGAFQLMKTVVPRMEAYIDENINEEFDAKELATLFTMDSVSNSVFGIASDCFKDSQAPFRQMGELAVQDQLQSWTSYIIFSLPRLRDLLGIKFVPKVVNDYIVNMVKEVVKFRAESDFNGSDLFQSFMKKEKTTSGGDLTELTGFGMTFFLEGFESSSMVASVALYYLAVNPKVQDTLYEEVSEALSGDKGDDLDFDNINNLKYLDKVLQESQRILPVMYHYVRVCTKPITLEINGKPIAIEPGTPVIIPVYSLHHDPQYFPDPDVFDPERFNEENKAARPQYTYMPMGEGPRMCPGMKFGLTQIKLFIANLVYRYRILSTSRTPSRLTFSAVSFLVVPNEKEWIKLEKRNQYDTKL